MTSPWQLLLCWGLLVGVGTGSMSMAFVATITGRWFVARRGLVSGVLTAAGATGQLVFLPLIAALATEHGWRVPAVVVAFAALAVIPVVLLAMRDFPADIGTTAYGAGPDTDEVKRTAQVGSSAARAVRILREAARARRRSGCSRPASRSAVPPRSAWSAPTSCPPRTTTACRRRSPRRCSP